MGNQVVSQTTDSRGRGSHGAQTESQGSLTHPLSGKTSEQNLGTRSGAGVRSLEPRARAQAWSVLNIKLNQWLMDPPEITEEALTAPLLRSSQKQPERFRNLDRADDCPQGRRKATVGFGHTQEQILSKRCINSHAARSTVRH